MTGTALAPVDHATPELVDQAERALALVEAPEDAKLLLQKVAAIDEAARLMQLHADVQLRAGRLRLRAERRYGELLPPARIGRPPANVASAHVATDSERSAMRRARRVAAVPEATFEDYLTATTDPERLSRSSLLTAAHEQPSGDGSAIDLQPDPEHREPRSQAPLGRHTPLSTIDLWQSGVDDEDLATHEQRRGFDRVDFLNRVGQMRNTLDDLAERVLSRAPHAAGCGCDRPRPNGEGGCHACGRRLQPRDRGPGQVTSPLVSMADRGPCTQRSGAACDPRRVQKATTSRRDPRSLNIPLPDFCKSEKSLPEPNLGSPVSGE